MYNATTLLYEALRFSLEYGETKTMIVSDAVRRHTSNVPPLQIQKESYLIHQVHWVVDLLPSNTRRLTQTQQETASEPVLQQLKQFIRTGCQRILTPALVLGLFILYGYSYVIIADYTSKYIDIEHFPDVSSQLLS